MIVLDLKHKCFILLLLGILNGVNTPIYSSNPKSLTSFGTTTVSNYTTKVGDVGDIFTEGSWSSVTLNVRNAPDGIFGFADLDPLESSYNLITTDYNLNIPCNAVITEISFDVTRRNAGIGDVVDDEIRLRLPDYSYGSLNLASSNVWLESTTDWETVTYTSSNWGEVLTGQMINDQGFGLSLSATNTDSDNSTEIQVDAVQMTVCYTVTGDPYDAIDLIVDKESDICGNCNGTINMTATAGSGTYEYSIDGGATWQSNSTFENLCHGPYEIIARNSDMTCETKSFYCYVGTSDKLFQPGDAIVACKPLASDPVTLVVESVQPFYDFEQAGILGTDVSCMIEPIMIEFTSDDLGGPVYSLAIDQNDDIYTVSSSLYNLSQTSMGTISTIDANSGAVTQLASIPGSYGGGGIAIDTVCDQLYVTNLEDGMIYRFDQNGTLLTTFDPLGTDDGLAGLAPLGERLFAVSMNYAENRLYYSVWVNDAIRNGGRNVIRSIAIDPTTCDFLLGSDRLEIELPFLSEDCGSVFSTFSMPVSDIEFTTDGTTMIVGETGYNSSTGFVSPHQSRVLEFDGSTSSWTKDGVCKHEIGRNGVNSRGGVEITNAGFDDNGCPTNLESHILGTADILQSTDCVAEGCIYGLQYSAITGQGPSNSVILDMGRDPYSQEKAVYGDVDVIMGCGIIPITCSLSATPLLCFGDNDALITVISTGGESGNFEYSIDGGMTYHSSNEFANLDGGMYTVITRDPANPTCNESCDITIAEPAELTCSVTINAQPSCENETQGSLTAVPIGGTPTMTYVWSTGATAASLTNLAFGTYTVTVTDNNGCESTCEATLLEPTNCCTDPNCFNITTAVNDGSEDLTNEKSTKKKK